jgi:hypothetical protein
MCREQACRAAVDTLWRTDILDPALFNSTIVSAMDIASSDRA